MENRIEVARMQDSDLYGVGLAQALETLRRIVFGSSGRGRY